MLQQLAKVTTLLFGLPDQLPFVRIRETVPAFSLVFGYLIPQDVSSLPWDRPPFVDDGPLTQVKYLYFGHFHESLVVYSK